MATQSDLDRPAGDESVEFSRRHGTTLVSTLRGIYGQGFAQGFADTDTLDNVLTGAPNHASLSQMLADYYNGDLQAKLGS